MKVGIFGNVFTNELTGIGRYAFNVCKHLEQICKNNFKFYILTNKTIIYNPFENADIIVEDNKILRKIPSVFWIRYFSHRYIKKLNLDVILSFLPYTPKFVPLKIKKIITVYDLNLYIVPQSMSFKTYIAYKLYFKKSILEADKIITISNGTKNKIKKYFQKETDVIVRPGVDTKLFNTKKTDKKPFNFNYILSVSTLEPRKNIDKLIIAFLILKKEGSLKNIKLVLVGKEGWKSKSIKKLIQEGKKDIIYTGYIDDRSLANLYKHADLFVFPSVYEGFGIPVLEARSCGCCVIATDIPELREACGEGCIYIKPTVESIKVAIEDFYNGRLKCDFDDFRPILWKDETKKLLEVLY